MKQTRFLALFLTLALLLTACGSSAPMSNDSAAGAYDAEYGRIEIATGETVAAVEELKSESASIDSVTQTDRKLIKTVTMDAETENYDELVNALESKIASLGGYTESRRTGTYGKTRRWSQMTLRIPADSLGDFVAHVTENANVLSTNETTQDVTLQYVDTEAKIKALETEQARLMELLAEAQNLSEILEIEARLSDVTYELERYASQKRSYDNQVSYATVHLTIEEVQTLTPVEEPTVWERISDGFMDSLEGVGTGITDLFVFLIAGSPYLVVWGIIGFCVSLILRKLRRKKQKLPQAPPLRNPLTCVV